MNASHTGSGTGISNLMEKYYRFNKTVLEEAGFELGDTVIEM